MLQKVPESISIPFNCWRRRSTWTKNGILFIHVPKAAGTSISYAIYGRSLGHLKAIEISRWCPNEFSSLFKFAFVRNPWDRLVSAYRFAVKGQTEIAGMRNSKQYKTNPFRSFDSFVYEWLYEKDLMTLDYVFQPQHLFISDENKISLVDFIGKVELFDHDLEKVSEITGKTIDSLNLNRISKQSNYIQYYKDSQLINSVGDIYHDDVSFLGYDFK